MSYLRKCYNILSYKILRIQILHRYSKWQNPYKQLMKRNIPAISANDMSLCNEFQSLAINTDPLVSNSLDTLSTIGGYSFKNIASVKDGFYHPSMKKENSQYERFEYLGDSILNCVIAEELFDRFPNEDQGSLTKRRANLVSMEACKKISILLNLDSVINVSGISKNLDDTTVLSDFIEVVIGAIYLDCGRDMNIVRKFILSNWKSLLDNSLDLPKDPKSELQELTLKYRLGIPNYIIINQAGLDHEPLFCCSCSIRGNLIISGISIVINESTIGKGKKKIKAEKDAAISMLTHFKCILKRLNVLNDSLVKNDFISQLQMWVDTSSNYDLVEYELEENQKSDKESNIPLFSYKCIIKSCKETKKECIGKAANSLKEAKHNAAFSMLIMLHQIKEIPLDEQPNEYQDNHTGYSSGKSYVSILKQFLEGKRFKRGEWIGPEYTPYQSGPDHSPTFTTTITLTYLTTGQQYQCNGIGHTKKNSQNNAAYELLLELSNAGYTEIEI